MYRRSERGFILVDLAYRLFDGSAWQILLRWIGLGLLGYLALVTLPMYRQAYQVHDAVISISRMSGFSEQTNAEVLAALDGALAQRKLALKAREIVTIQGRGENRVLAVAYDAKAVIEDGDSISMRILVEFCFDQHATRIQALTGASCRPT